MLAEVGHRFRLRPPEPAREHGEISGMLRPPDRNPRIRKHERQIGEIRSLVDPPTGLKAQQDLYDVADPMFVAAAALSHSAGGSTISFRRGRGTVRTTASYS